MNRHEDLYAMVTDRLIAEIGKDGLRWLKGWTSRGLPMNGLSRKQYRGINMFWLSMEMQSRGYGSNKFYTFDNVRQLKGHVKAGSKGIPVFFFKILEKTVENAEGEQVIRKIPLMRSFMVFNQDQTSLVDRDEAIGKIPIERIQTCESIVAWSDCPKIHTDTKAYYSPSRDTIGMPDIDEFHTAELYYATLFHEIVHSTGSKDRLNRAGLTAKIAFGSDIYSQEEIIAELGASVLCAKADIFEANIKNNGAYIQYWLRQLKADKRFIFKVMRQVQASVDLILRDKRD